MTIFVGAVWKFSLALWSYNLEQAEVHLKSSLCGSQQTFVFMKTSWRSFENVFRLCLQKMSSRRLDQGEHIHLNDTSSEDVFKTFSRRLDQYICLGHTSSWRLQDVFKTLAKASSRHLQDLLPSHIEDFFKTSSRGIAKISSRHLHDVFKIYHQNKLFLLIRFPNVFET